VSVRYGLTNRQFIVPSETLQATPVVSHTTRNDGLFDYCSSFQTVRTHRLSIWPNSFVDDFHISPELQTFDLSSRTKEILGRASALSAGLAAAATRLTGLIELATLLDAGDRRLPVPGTVLTRVYKGETLMVSVLPTGFEFEGEVYKSLSAVAKKITGSHCNGYLSFRLIKQGGDR